MHSNRHITNGWGVITPPPAQQRWVGCVCVCVLETVGWADNCQHLPDLVEELVSSHPSGWRWSCSPPCPTVVREVRRAWFVHGLAAPAMRCRQRGGNICCSACRACNLVAFSPITALQLKTREPAATANARMNLVNEYTCSCEEDATCMY